MPKGAVLSAPFTQESSFRDKDVDVDHELVTTSKKNALGRELRANQVSPV